jgi:hypothetical protein
MRRRCSAKSKQTGVRCKRQPIPFGPVCIFHGGYLPSVRAKAEREYLATLAGERGYLSQWQKNELVRNWEAAQRRYATRLHKKYGIDPDTLTPTEPAPVRALEPIPYEPPDGPAEELTDDWWD